MEAPASAACTLAKRTGFATNSLSCHASPALSRALADGGEGRIVFPSGTSLTQLSTKLRRVIMGASDHQKSPVGMSLPFFIIAVATGLACLYFIFWA